METISIVKAGMADLAVLQQISRQTFTETFAESNHAADMEAYVAGSFSQEKLAGELYNEQAEFYFAMLGEAVTGYLKINFGAAQTELQSSHAMEIERIYVLQQYKGKQAGQLLYKKALQRATEAGVDYIWLGVWEQNENAIGFYRKNGFVAFDKHIFQLGSDAQTDIMMKRVL